jgi:ribosome modulation factor
MTAFYSLLKFRFFPSVEAAWLGGWKSHGYDSLLLASEVQVFPGSVEAAWLGGWNSHGYDSLLLASEVQVFPDP